MYRRAVRGGMYSCRLHLLSINYSSDCLLAQCPIQATTQASKMYLSKLQAYFSKCICPRCKMYFPNCSILSINYSSDCLLAQCPIQATKMYLSIFVHMAIFLPIYTNHLNDKIVDQSFHDFMIFLSWIYKSCTACFEEEKESRIKLFLLPPEELMIAKGKLVERDKLLFPFSCWQGANAKTSKY